MNAALPLSHAVEHLLDEELLVVQQAIALMGKSLDQAHVIREMLHLLSELLGLNRGRVMLPDATGALSIAHAYGLTDAEIERGRYHAGEGISGQVMHQGQTVIVQDVDREPQFLFRAVARSQLPQETVSYICQPLRHDGRVLGVLGVHRLRDRARPLARDLHILNIAATLIAQVIVLNRYVVERTAQLESENRSLRRALNQDAGKFTALGIVGVSLPLRHALRQIEQVGATGAGVLLLGESGTGKELFARALHLSSARRDQAFVKVNCGAIPENLFESELFGYEKGAFTGANGARAGYFEQADKGTLLLDEVGDLPLPMQVKLLRVLQEQSIQRLGAKHEIAIDVRIVAATNQDLSARVADGQFRLDLFYRLNIIPITLPALRERREDIPHLVRHTLAQINLSYQRTVSVSTAALDRLVAYDWPGNIRQLRNVLERLALLAETSVVDAHEVSQALIGEGRQARQPAAAAATAPLATGTAVRAYFPVQENDRSAIEQALLASGGNKSRAAQQLGLTLRQLSYRMGLLGISARPAARQNVA
jgi:Nif-specific regulatory protein